MERNKRHCVITHVMFRQRPWVFVGMWDCNKEDKKIKEGRKSVGLDGSHEKMESRWNKVLMHHLWAW
jgi:hypothetical protein